MRTQQQNQQVTCANASATRASSLARHDALADWAGLILLDDVLRTLCACKHVHAHVQGARIRHACRLVLPHSRARLALRAGARQPINSQKRCLQVTTTHCVLGSISLQQPLQHSPQRASISGALLAQAAAYLLQQQQSSSKAAAAGAP